MSDWKNFCELCLEKDTRIAELEAEIEDFRQGFIREGCRAAGLEAEIEEIHATGGCSYQRLETAQSRIEELEAERNCHWSALDDEYGNEWSASCGLVWIFNDDGPEENQTNFCPKCGGKVVIDPPEKDDD